MSPANLKYFINHNPEFKHKVEVMPNAIKLENKKLIYTREELGLEKDSVIFVYGGNLGYPQAIESLVECAKAIEGLDKVQFVVAGTGAKQKIIENYVKDYSPKNFKYLGQLAKEEYDELVYLSDVGLIFLDHRFTIPNYPQRLLSYLEASLPIIVAADKATDIGVIAEENNYGINVYSEDVEAFKEAVKKLSKETLLRKEMGKNGYKFLEGNYTVEKAYEIIESRIKWKKY